MKISKRLFHNFGGWFVPCRIFAPRGAKQKNTTNWPFCCTFAPRDARRKLENTTKLILSHNFATQSATQKHECMTMWPFFVLSLCARRAKIRHDTNRPPYITDSYSCKHYVYYLSDVQWDLPAKTRTTRKMVHHRLHQYIWFIKLYRIYFILIVKEAISL
jgi:hypothetical protein